MIEIYSTTTCHYCQKAKDLLQKKGMAFVEHDISDPEARRLMIEKTGYKTVPIIFIHGTLIGGFDDLAKLNAEGKLDAMVEGEG